MVRFTLRCPPFDGRNVVPKDILSDAYIMCRYWGIFDGVGADYFLKFLSRWELQHMLQLPCPFRIFEFTMSVSFFVILDCVHK